MKKHIIILLVFSLLFFNCKKKINKLTADVTQKTTIDSLKTSRIIDTVIVKNKKSQLTGNYDFKKALNFLRNINHTKNRYKDWVSNYGYVFSRLIELNSEEFQVKTTSYTYKKDCVFYLHTLTHTKQNL